MDVAGLRLLLTGDVEPEAQAALAGRCPGSHVDVLKLPHHGSRHQDLASSPASDPRRAGAGGGGQRLRPPAPSVLAPFEAAGADVLRTDQDGDLVVVVRDGSLLTATRD